MRANITTIADKLYHSLYPSFSISFLVLYLRFKHTAYAALMATLRCVLFLIFPQCLLEPHERAKSNNGRRLTLRALFLPLSSSHACVCLCVCTTFDLWDQNDPAALEFLLLLLDQTAAHKIGSKRAARFDLLPDYDLYFKFLFTHHAQRAFSWLPFCFMTLSQLLPCTKGVWCLWHSGATYSESHLAILMSILMSIKNKRNIEWHKNYLYRKYFQPYSESRFTSRFYWWISYSIC